MKVRTQRSIPQANRIFTDREEPRASFWKNYTLCKTGIQGDGDIRVLTYYGIGGIGKSSLLKKLMSEMDEQLSSPKYVYFDFNVYQEHRAVLEALKTKLSETYGFSFPLFELGVYVYAKKIGEESNSPQIEAYIDKSPFLNLLFSIAGKIPVVSIASEVLSLADKGIALARTYLSNHRRELAEMEYKDAAELYDYLPYLFSLDMANNLKDATEPLVLFLDTYERLVNEMAAIGEPLNNDLWLRGENGLIQNTPNTFWVIAGREKLRWERFDADWASSLEQHILGNLSLADSEHFLANAGIGNAELRQQLYRLTDGTPVYLDLCVDRFLYLTEKGIAPDISKFGDNIHTLIERFARYMDDAKQDIVYFLACMQQWNDTTIMDIAEQVLPNFSITTYEKVKNFSFIIQSGDGNYTIHQTVGSVLFENCHSSLKFRVAQYATTYFQKKLSLLNAADPDYGAFLEQLLRFAIILYDQDEPLRAFYETHIESRLLKLCEIGRSSQANAVLEAFLSKAAQNTESLLYASVIRSRACFLECAGMYPQSAALAEEAVSRYKQLLGEDDLDTLIAMNICAIAWSHINRRKEALEIQRLVLEKRKTALGEEHPDTLSAMNNLAITLRDHQNYEEAFALQDRVLTVRRTALGEAHPQTLAAMNNLTATLYALNRKDEALQLCEQVLEKRRAILGENHPDTLDTMNNLANILFALGQPEEALSLRRQLLEKRQALLGENHPDTIRAVEGIAAALEELKRHDEATPLRRQVWESRRALLGREHPDVHNASFMLEYNLECREAHTELLILKQQELEECKTLYGDHHTKTLEVLLRIIGILHDLKRLDEVLPLQEQVCEILRVCPQKAWSEDISTAEKLVSIYKELQKYEEAIPLQKHIVETLHRTGKLRSFLRESLDSMHKLADLYKNAKQYDKACAVLEQIVTMYEKDPPRSDVLTLTTKLDLADAMAAAGKQEAARELQIQVYQQTPAYAKRDPAKPITDIDLLRAKLTLKKRSLEETETLIHMMLSAFREDDQVSDDTADLRST